MKKFSSVQKLPAKPEQAWKVYFITHCLFKVHSQVTF